MEKLSIVIITKNEERNIERCLKSIVDIADDIVVVDSFSEDKTKEICEKYEVNIVQNEWLGYSNQKNLANKLAKYKWILSIDADEALDDELKESINKIKTQGFGSNYYEVSRLNNYCGKWIKHGSWYPDRKIRIFNKELSQWEGDIHETINISEGIEVKCLKGKLLHYTFYTIGEHLSQINKFTELSSIKHYKAGKKENLLNAIIKSKLKFFRDYFIKLGFLDGKMGFVVCFLSSFSSFVKYLKIIQLRHVNRD